MSDRGNPQPVQRRKELQRTISGVLVRLGLAVATAAVIAAPIAVSWAVTRTHVQQSVGVTPTTFSISTAGYSEVRLGIAGTIHIPLARGPFGVVAAVEGPAVPEAGISDLASYVSPEVLELYTGLFHNPEPAIQGYLDLVVSEFWHQFVVAELFLAGVGGFTLLLLQQLLMPRAGAFAKPFGALPQPWVARGVIALLVALIATSTLAFLQMRPVKTAGVADAAGGAYELSALDGTMAEGATTSSPLLRNLLAGLVPRVQMLIERQEEQVRQYREMASDALQEQVASTAGPREGETAVLMQADMHCSTTMIALQRQVVSLLRERYGPDVPALMAITGDLTTNGTPAEGGCIEQEAAIAQGAPIAAVTGNHESDLSVEQMQNAGMTVLTGETTDLGGVSVLGDGDPERSELFGATSPRGSETQEDVGVRLYEAAGEHRPDLLLVHEAYAAEAFIGTSDMTDFLEGRADPSTRYDDHVRDLPASAVLYGHWHRSIDPRVVWNSDGTWTLVMELNTAGGAIDTPTIGRFSTPWSSPQQDASFPVLFVDRTSGLVTGYQLYEFTVQGDVTVHPRIDIGDSP